MLNQKDLTPEEKLYDLMQQIIDELKSSNKNSERIQQLLKDISKNSQTLIDKASSTRKMFCCALTIMALMLIFLFFMNSKLASLRSSNNDMSYKGDLILKEIKEIKTPTQPLAQPRQNTQSSAPINQTQYYHATPNVYPNLSQIPQNNQNPNMNNFHYDNNNAFQPNNTEPIKQ